MMYAPVGRCVVGKPEVCGSKGQRIIQCGPILIGGSVLSVGSESLRCVAPASMYSMPGTVLVGFGLCFMLSLFRCVATSSAHMGGSPTSVALPGIQVHPLVPGRSTCRLPWLSISAMVAPFVTFLGPAERARAILVCVDSFASTEYSEECICAMPAEY